MTEIRRHYAEVGNPLNPTLEIEIRRYINETGEFSTFKGVPGLHAEIQSVNDVLNQLENAGYVLNRSVLASIDSATFKLWVPNQGGRFEACPNCDGILRSVRIRTGRDTSGR